MDIICTQCQSFKIIKNGKYKDLQKYKCTECSYQFKVETKISEQVKGKSVVLYNLGFSIPKISQLMRTSSVNVLNWLKKDMGKNEGRGITCEPVKGNPDGEGSLIIEIELD